MTMDNDAPARPPPKNIGQRPVKKAKADAEMKDESGPGSKAPALSSSKPSAPKGVTKDPTGPKIVEEDLGAGLSAEEAAALAADVWSPGIIAAFEEAKWQDKIAGGFEPLQE